MRKLVLAVALVGAACGNFLGLDEPNTPREPPDANALGSADGDPLVDGPTTSSEGASNEDDASTASDAPKSDAGLDGATINNPTCASKRSRTDGGCDPAVFITKNMFNGTLPNVMGGIGASKGDNICAESKAAGDLSGDFRAWLSDSKGPADIARWPMRSTRPYRNLNGDLIADDFAQLAKSQLNGGGPKMAINLSETLTPVPSNEAVWTGTLVDATPGALRCTSGADWNGTGNARGIYGFPTTGDTWTHFGDAQCLASAHLYCFEQQP